MGAWGTDTFENDTACDWALGLAEGGMARVEASIDGVLGAGSGYLDADLACEGLAACDVLARLRGRFGQRDAYTEPVDAWVEAHAGDPPQELITKAVAVVDRVVARDSELAELWSESDEEAAWRTRVAGLRERLGDTERTP